MCWCSLSVVEQRYRAVLEVLDEGVPVIEVAGRYGVARQTVHEWLPRTTSVTSTVLFRLSPVSGSSPISRPVHHRPLVTAAPDGHSAGGTGPAVNVATRCR